MLSSFCGLATLSRLSAPPKVVPSVIHCAPMVAALDFARHEDSRGIAEARRYNFAMYLGNSSGKFSGNLSGNFSK
jgi:hypothetical protein